MNIKARIVARKVIFCYFFEQYFVALSGEKSAMVEEIDKIAYHMHDTDTEVRDVAAVLNQNYYAESDEEVAYLIKRFFEYQGTDENKEVAPDREYIKKMAPCFWKYEPIVRDLVNTHTVTFSFDQMDVLDRVIFVLWYAEFKEMGTPKEVVINEMVEFGKRYGDESSFKLLNGIAHKLFTPEEGDTPKKMSPIDLVVGN